MKSFGIELLLDLYDCKEGEDWVLSESEMCSIVSIDYDMLTASVLDEASGRVSIVTPEYFAKAHVLKRKTLFERLLEED